jgi:hypothetical protein
LHLSSLLISSIQTDTEILLPCFERYIQHIFTLQLALKRWKERKTKLLSAVKHSKAKKQEKIDKEAAKIAALANNAAPLSPSSKPYSKVFDRWFQQRPSPAPQSLQRQCIEESLPVSSTPPSPQEVMAPSLITVVLDKSCVAPLVGEIAVDDAPDNPITTSDSEKQLPTPTLSQPLDLEIARWDEVVNDLREEYQQLSEQTLNEFHPFMENKKLLVFETIFQYATRQVWTSPLFIPSLFPVSFAHHFGSQSLVQLSNCQQSHQVWEDTMSSLLEDNPSYDLETLPPLPTLSSPAVSQYSRHSFIHKFGLINLSSGTDETDRMESSAVLGGKGLEDLVIQPVFSFLGDDREDEGHPLYVSDSGTIEI